MSSAEVGKGKEMKQTLAVVFVLGIVIAATVGFLSLRGHSAVGGYVIVVGAVFILSIGAGMFLKSSRKN